MGKEGEHSGRVLDMALGSLLGGALAAGVALLLLLAAAVAISSGVMPEELERHVTIAACAIGGFCGGLLARERWQSRALFAGLSAGLVFFLLLLSVSLLGFGGPDFSGGTLGVLAGCLGGGALAGLFSKKGRKKKKRFSALSRP